MTTGHRATQHATSCHGPGGAMWHEPQASHNPQASLQYAVLLRHDHNTAQRRNSHDPAAKKSKSHYVHYSPCMLRKVPSSLLLTSSSAVTAGKSMVPYCRAGQRGTSSKTHVLVPAGKHTTSACVTCTALLPFWSQRILTRASSFSGLHASIDMASCSLKTAADAPSQDHIAL